MTSRIDSVYGERGNRGCSGTSGAVVEERDDAYLLEESVLVSARQMQLAQECI
jgi:hypothetical protein